MKLTAQTEVQLLVLRESLKGQRFQDEGNNDYERGQRVGWNAAMSSVTRQIDEILTTALVLPTT